MYNLAKQIISDLHFHIEDDLKPIHDSDIFSCLFVKMRHVTTNDLVSILF